MLKTFSKGDFILFQNKFKEYAGFISDIPEFDSGILIVEYRDKKDRLQTTAISEHNILIHHPLGE